ncbi:metallopeptidase TldD-related protein [Clostridium sp.]|uniref:metallopeptidase TldD-related protein n=1 Tax=Clostridium sp. TaxID=1506 RepID=UPI00284AA3AB|nr:metallopeptidase TldD-related protein [Clostridium sp.]MDR3596738.1 metallopeptidase TldD-related protein [Clostridium sp.]
MLDKIKQILKDNKNINGYKIVENEVEAIELFFIKKNVDMDRAKDVQHFKVTVYKDIEENGEKYKGLATTNIHPTMSNEEIDKAINEALFAAQYAKNPYYPLVKPVSKYKSMAPSEFSKENLHYWINEVTKAVYINDNYEKGGINSCEIFLNKVYTHIVNSEGVDAESLGYECMVEFITTWQEDGEEVELYKCLNFSELDVEGVAREVENMIKICRDKAIAKSTPSVEKASVLFTGKSVQDLFSFYYSKSSAIAIYKNESTWKVGDKIQGEEVKGDLITMTLDPFMKNSTCSASFDGDGFPLELVTIVENGVLKRYIADNRYAHYLNVEPTGSINNIVVSSGSKTIEELKAEPYIEAAAFSDFTMDELTGDFCGEIRLAWYFDGKDTIPVTGGSISGNINELQNQMFLSKEIEKHNNFEGPKVVKLLNVTVAGV